MKYFVEKVEGIDCIFIPMDSVNCISAQVWFKVWSNCEKEKEWWVNHCLEHMILKWGKEYESAADINNYIDSIWWIINWSTSHNITKFRTEAPFEYTDEVISILWDLLCNTKLDEEALQNEKSVIIQELRRSNDDIIRTTRTQRREWYVWNWSIWRNIIWSEESINLITKDKLNEYKNNYFTKNNALIIVAWKIENIEWIKEKIKKEFWWLLEWPSILPCIYKKEFPKEKIKIIDSWIKQPSLLISFEWFRAFERRKCLTADIIAMLLWWNKSSVLFSIIRWKEWLVYWIKAGHEDAPEFWNFCITTQINKEKLEYWIKKILEIVKDFLSNKISQIELDKAVWCLCGRIMMAVQTPSQAVNFIWNQRILGSKINTPEEIAELYRWITLNEVNNMMTQLSNQDLYTFCIE